MVARVSQGSLLGPMLLAVNTNGSFLGPVLNETDINPLKARIKLIDI
jgi:hypothetical protein